MKPSNTPPVAPDPPERRRVSRRVQREPTRNRFGLAYIVISTLVVCSMLAVAITTIDLSGLFGNEDTNFGDPNADLVADQQTAVARNPTDVDEVVLLANLLGNTGRIQEAVPWYEEALKLAPEDHGIRLDFARSLAGANLLTDAEAQFRRVLEDDPENQTAHYYLAELYLSWSPPRRPEAAEHYAEAIAIDPGSFLAERARIELDAMTSATPVASPPRMPAASGQ